MSGVRPISDIGTEPSFAAVGEVPYVAWSERHGASHEVFVAHLNSDGTAWVKVGGPVNADPSHDASGPSLASINGVPYVAWSEYNGAHSEVRVARLNTAGTSWVEPWRGSDATSGGINQNSAADAVAARLASVGGVPYVAWDERTVANPHHTVRVARLDTSTVPSPTWVQPGVGAGATTGGIGSTVWSSFLPDIASINGLPYVAWLEEPPQGGAYGFGKIQMRVARLNPANGMWEQPWAGVSATYGGINQAANRSAGVPSSADSELGRPSLASINAFPTVAWIEDDGTNTVARVARLDTSTPGAPTWKQEATGVTDTDGGINQSPTAYAASLSLAAVSAAPFGGETPYLAWTEASGTPPNVHTQIRVARFNKATHGWEQPWPGVSQTYGGINSDPMTSADSPSLESVGGVPWLARIESGVRVSRLEPEFSSQSVTSSANTATFTVTAHTYGIGYPTGFEYGNLLQHDSTVTNTALGQDSIAITENVGGLTPATTYQYQPFALAGLPAPRALGTALSFTTVAAPPNTSHRATISALAETNSVFAAGRFSTALTGLTAAKRHPLGTVFSFRLDRSANVKIAIRTDVRGRRVGRACKPDSRALRRRPVCQRPVVVLTLTRGAHAGLNKLPFTARIHGRSLKPDSYEAAFTPTNAAGASPPGSLGFQLVKR